MRAADQPRCTAMSGLAARFAGERYLGMPIDREAQP
jgi:hypothetical protein